MDTKALILERCTELVDKMTNLLQYLKLKLQPSESRYGTPEIEAEITKNYELFESLLTDTGTDENPQPQLYKSDGTFHDETIANDKLFGDVRQDLEQFYEGFNAVFVKSKKVFSNGIRNSSGELDGNKILNNIKNLKQYMID
jgi:hypothetical protein